MAVRISEAVRNAELDAITTAVDAGSGAGLLRIYTGSQPATAATAASGTLLVEIALNDPSFGAASGGVITLDDDPQPGGAAVSDGTAGWARVLDSDETTVFDGSVGTSGADFTINTAAITTGQTVKVTGGTLTRPAA